MRLFFFFLLMAGGVCFTIISDFTEEKMLYFFPILMYATLVGVFVSLNWVRYEILEQDLGQAFCRYLYIEFVLRKQQGCNSRDGSSFPPRAHRASRWP